MSRPKYPVGIQTFSKIIEGGYTYVDKTRYIAELIYEEGYYFLSRPRRFGKSLLLSTLHAYFDGRRDLFKGLALDRMDVEWTPRPVLHFDFNSENFKDPEGLYKLLDSYLRKYEDIYGYDTLDCSLAQRFRSLINNVFTLTGKKVVVLVDEYDKPLLDIEDNAELFAKNQAVLKGFFGNLKTMDRYISFAFMTGVARFNKVSIFSDLNNLDDISLSNKYADICGWTEAEMLSVFNQGLLTLAQARGEDLETTLRAMKTYYDGYLFAPQGNRLYNPFSVLRALRNGEIKPYWFETGTPTFLARRVKRSGIVLSDLDDVACTEEELQSVGADTRSPLPLMFQTGYLTIDTYDSDLKVYTLRFPNREVEVGFAKQLLPLYIPEKETDKGFSLVSFKRDLFSGNPEGFMTRLRTLFKGMAHELQNERNYQSIVWLICTLAGSDTLGELHSYNGRSDLEVQTPEYVYVFEFKYNRSVAEAMGQLHNRDYAGRYALDHRKIYLIGANFSSTSAQCGLTAWEIEEMSF